MKKKVARKRLVLNLELIRVVSLSPEQLEQIRGGSADESNCVGCSEAGCTDPK
jgi:hypothetical protein